jgi:hypothetical protein
MGGTKIKTKIVLIDFLNQNQKLLIKLKNREIGNNLVRRHSIS